MSPEQSKISMQTISRFRRSNVIVFSALAAAVGGIYFYTMWSVRDQGFTDEELNTRIKKN